MKLSGKKALITGASKGIGRSISLRLAKEGCELTLIARNYSDLEKVSAECRQLGAKVYPIPFDVSRFSEIETIVGKAVQAMGGLNILINNAGASGGGKSDVADLTVWDRVIDINLKSVMHFSRHALPAIKTDSEGAIINISSISGRMGFGGSGGYCASKHGVNGFSECLFEDIRQHGIKVAAINPGYVNTSFVGGDNFIRENMIQPDDISDAVFYVLNSPSNCCPTEITIRPQRAPFK